MDAYLNSQHGLKLQGISVLIGLFAGLNARAKTYRIIELPGEHLWVHVCWLSIMYRNCYEALTNRQWPRMEFVWHSIWSCFLLMFKLQSQQATRGGEFTI